MDILVSSGGYGTVQHALRNGVPVVLVGNFADKVETGAIVRYTGVGMHYVGPATDSETLRTSVEEILHNPSYREKAEAMKQRYLEYEPVEQLDSIIQERTRWFDELTK